MDGCDVNGSNISSYNIQLYVTTIQVQLYVTIFQLYTKKMDRCDDYWVKI